MRPSGIVCKTLRTKSKGDFPNHCAAKVRANRSFTPCAKRPCEVPQHGRYVKEREGVLPLNNGARLTEGG